jgi:hypothetical protein
MKIITEFGRSFELSAVAYQALKECRFADQAEKAFAEFAPHIPKARRAEVWNVIPSETDAEIAERLTRTAPRATYTIPSDLAHLIHKD